MNRSEQIGELAAALAKAQGQIEGAAKDKTNPFFAKNSGGGKYADLSSVWDACRGPLSSNGLAVVQEPELGEKGITLTTTLFHASGQWTSSVLSAPLKETTPQAIGSLITYLRRYSLSAVVGVAPEDDDAEAAMGRAAPKSGNSHSKAQVAQALPIPPEEQLYARLSEALPEGWTEAEKEKWKEAHRAEIEKLPAIYKNALVEEAKKVPVKA